MGSKMEVSEAEIQKVYHRDCISSGRVCNIYVVYFKYDITTGFTGSGRFDYKNNYDLYCVGDWKCIVPRTFCSLQTLKKKQRCDL